MQARTGPVFSAKAARCARALTSIAVCVSVVLVAAREARAQSVTLNPLVNRYYPDQKTPYPLRDQSLNPTALNFQDCEDNIVLNFSLLLSAPSASYTLEAWAGTDDCTQLAARTPATETCWPLLPGGIMQSGTPAANIFARDIIAHIADITKPATYASATEQACHNQATSGPTTVNVYFFFVDGTNNPAGTAAPAYPVTVSTLGPAAPTGVSVDFGDTLLIANWTPPTDQNALAYNVFCDPAPGFEDAGPVTSFDAGVVSQTVCDSSVVTTFTDATMSVDDSGEAGDADGTGTPIMTVVDGGCFTELVPIDSGAVASSCPSALLVSGGGTSTSDEAGNVTSSGGTTRAIPPKYLCGGGGGGVSSGAVIKHLQNGVRYTVAVAGTDAYGNNGPLSDPGCQTPQLIDDFWDVYKRDGGGAGGNFCALEGVGIPAGTGVFAVGMISAMVALVRRRRRRAR